VPSTPPATWNIARRPPARKPQAACGRAGGGRVAGCVGLVCPAKARQGVWEDPACKPERPGGVCYWSPGLGWSLNPPHGAKASRRERLAGTRRGVPVPRHWKERRAGPVAAVTPLSPNLVAALASRVCAPARVRSRVRLWARSDARAHTIVTLCAFLFPVGNKRGASSVEPLKEQTPNPYQCHPKSVSCRKQNKGTYGMMFLARQSKNNLLEVPCCLSIPGALAMTPSA
jgi:hypothetical protein